MSLGEDWINSCDSLILGFDQVLSGEKMLTIPSAHKIVKAYSQKGYLIHGITGFKGDLLRILANYALKQKDPYREVLGWTHPIYIRELVIRLGTFEF